MLFDAFCLTVLAFCVFSAVCVCAQVKIYGVVDNNGPTSNLPKLSNLYSVGKLRRPCMCAYLEKGYNGQFHFCFSTFSFCIFQNEQKTFESGFLSRWQTPKIYWQRERNYKFLIYAANLMSRSSVECLFSIIFQISYLFKVSKQKLDFSLDIIHL